MKRIILFCGFILTLFTNRMQAQILTREDSLAAGLQMSGKITAISGYGEAMVSYDKNEGTANANITRFVTFLGHRFNKNITLFSEMELENTKVANGSVDGEISLEQMFLKFDLNRSAYLVAGLYTPRIGIINENHLPTTYNGNQRHFIEKYLIPATWRELGVGLYGRFDRLPGFNYYIGITNGLNSAGFEHGSGIREGRYEGSNASASNIAFHAAALYYYKQFRFQASAYYGGSAGINAKQADSLKLNNDLLGTPIALAEINVQYHGKRLGFKSLATVVNIPEASAINRAYANNTPEMMLGTFAEISYQMLDYKDFSAKKLIAFARYEAFNLNQQMPFNGIRDQSLNQQFLILGLTYKPTPGVALKADVVNRTAGDRKNDLLNTFPQLPPYSRNNWYFNLGFAYSF